MGKLTGEWKEKNGIWYQKENFYRWVRYTEIECVQCHKKKRTRHPDSKTCSRSCMTQYRWDHTPKEKRHRVSRLHRKGYIYIRHPETGEEILEHRYLMEQEIKRPLTKDDFIHHINGITDDNRIENLLLMKRGDHNSHHKSEEIKTRERDSDGRLLPKH